MIVGDDEKLRDEAADRFARMRGSPSEEERAEHEAWLAADTRHAAAYRLVQVRWEQSAFLANTEFARDRDLNRAAVWHRQPIARRWIAACAVVVALIAASTFGLRHVRTAPDAVIASTSINNPASSVRPVRLADGSSVLLDAGAAITIRLSAGERRIELQRGRARFTVAHDASRPFIVEAAGGSVVAHGTVFDVSLTDGTVRITLLQGAVDVQRQPSQGALEARRLRPGQTTSYGQTGPIAEPRPISSADNGWANAMLTFERTPLADAAAAVSRRSGVAIRVDQRIAALPVSGAFRATDASGFAEAAAAMFDLRVERSASTLTLVPAQKP